MANMNFFTRSLVIIAFIGFLIGCAKAPNQQSFQLSPEKTLSLVSTDSYWVTPQEASNLEKNQDGSYLFIDIRPAVEFDKGSLKGALNIPIPNILDDESLAIFSGGKKTVLFGATEEEAHGPWLLLQQMGYDNVLLLLGGYTFQQQAGNISYTPPESRGYDYAALMAEAVKRDKAEEEATRPKPIPQPVAKAPKQIIPKKKPKPQAAEEEGC